MFTNSLELFIHTDYFVRIGIELETIHTRKTDVLLFSVELVQRVQARFAIGFRILTIKL